MPEERDIDLKPYNCTIRIFDTASTLANAASFTTKTEGDAAKPVAFVCVKIEAR